MKELTLSEFSGDDRKTFLLVEDSRDDAFLFEIEFKRCPSARLCIVRDGEEAIHYVQGKPPYDDRTEFPLPDVIFLDLTMPRMDGFEVLEWLRRQNLDDVELTPVVVMSGSISNEDVRLAYKRGANFFMTKPADPNQMRNWIRLLITLWCEYIKTTEHVSDSNLAIFAATAAGG